MKNRIRKSKEISNFSHKLKKKRETIPNLTALTGNYCGI